MDYEVLDSGTLRYGYTKRSIGGFGDWLIWEEILYD
jgi:hypothetical protein